ncbi:prepilin-type N-terminal cleavage/methylation domain-containing protein [Vibrio pectenicida]|uniref:Prepilin-type N-terminal cleavage/methylation domain-containing protein n=1 Tax=Vibrio pectenicida TaxID=62763 RepID=A0A7Y3ZXD1_9VIBR|nr:prepilin-type N-terminal cleavage/methylation domain-containing protein [Vibrio pectenicida]NOH69944.1 prepilin-type N-terminal cleavage/methylation domain-containing protein [Vibrio pectenicida]
MISNQAGTSLIEVLIALAIVAVSAMGLVKLHIDIETKAGMAEKRLSALNVAESRLEAFSAYGYWPEDCRSAVECIPLSYGQLQIHCTAESMLLDGTQAQKVKIDVCWQGRHGHVYSVSLNTLFSSQVTAAP